MTDKDYPSELTAEAGRLTDKLMPYMRNPANRGPVYNRSVESLGWIQEKSWEATDAKWSEIHAAEVERTEKAYAEGRRAAAPTCSAHGCDKEVTACWCLEHEKDRSDMYEKGRRAGLEAAKLNREPLEMLAKHDCASWQCNHPQRPWPEMCAPDIARKALGTS